MEENDQVLFELPIELELRKSEGGDRRIVRGYASTENMDQDGEVILQNGIDFSYLLKSGFLNYDHQYREIGGAKMPIIIGFPTKAEIRDKGLWVEGELLKSTDAGNIDSEQLRLADEMWALGMAFQKSGSNRSLAYSVEGGVLQRHGKKIVKSLVRHCAVTTKPVNPEATIELFQKSMCCGRCNANHPLYTVGHICGSHVPTAKEDKENVQKSLGTDAGIAMANGNSPVMRENLDRGFSSILYGPAQCNCYNPQTMEFRGGIAGAVEHLQKCQGVSKDRAIEFLRKAVSASGRRPDVAATLAAAGIVR